MERLPNKTRRTLDRDEQIAELKRQLAEMETSRQRKQLELTRRNEVMIVRDTERHEQFLRDFKTPEQVAAEAAQREVERIQVILDALQDREDDARLILEEEEQMENKLLHQENRLTFICLGVAVLYADYERCELQKALKQQELARVMASYDKLKQTLRSEESEARRQVERLYAGDWRVLENMKKNDYARVQNEVQRIAEEQRQRLERANAEKNQEDERKETELLEAEEDELWRRYQEKLTMIETRYLDLVGSVAPAREHEQPL